MFAAPPCPWTANLNAALQRSTRRLRLFAWSFAVFLLTLAITAGVLREYRRLLERERQEAAQRSGESMLSALYDQLKTGDILVRSMQAVYLASGDIDDDQFQRVVDTLQLHQRFAGLQAVVMARRSAPGQPLAYITDRVAPLAGNERVVGLDVVSQPTNLIAVERSRDLDRTVISASFRLIQRSGEDEPVDGVVIRLPAYSAGPTPQTVDERRQREIGSLGVSFRVSELVHAGLQQAFDPNYQVRVTDITDGAAVPLYDSVTYGRSAAGRSGARPITGRIEFGERVWEVSLLPVHAAGAASLSVALGWGGGLLLATVLALLVWSLVSRREHALALAEGMSRRFRESESRFRALNELLPVAVVLSHAGDGQLDYVNATGRRLLALGDSDAKQHRLVDFADPGTQHREAVDYGPQAPLAAAQAMRAGDGHRFWATLSEQDLELDDAPMRLSVISDISELRELTERLRYQAAHDSLTGLINRREFERRLELALQNPGETGHGLLYVDLDQFKLVNDVSGHLAGDGLLAQLGGVLHGVLGERDVIARLGGDEFGVLIGCGRRPEVLEVAERLRRAIELFVFTWDDKTYAVTASIGAVLLDAEHPRCQRELLSLADTACYMAKEAGRNRVQLYNDNDLATGNRLREMEWIGRLRSALAEDRLCLYYQELQPLKPRRAPQGAHFELLIRLRDETGELVPPGAFVPAAERFGLMPLLDRWVVKTALRQFATLHPAGADVAMCAINLSATTMEDEAFPAFVLDQLKRSGVPAERLCFEVTETAAVANMARVVSLIKRLRALGCRFALDDFGAGMSSFGYLKNLPLDYIKVDGSFIREIETDPMSYSIVRAVTDIGHQMGAEVIAEFVNSTRTCDLLRGLGVDYVQGFLIHEPEPTCAGEIVAA